MPEKATIQSGYYRQSERLGEDRNHDFSAFGEGNSQGVSTRVTEGQSQFEDLVTEDRQTVRDTGFVVESDLIEGFGDRVALNVRQADNHVGDIVAGLSGNTDVEGNDGAVRKPPSFG